MKKLLYIIIGLTMCATYSCQDMYDMSSDRMIYDPQLDQKTDSMFYTLGILRSMQQAIDQYVLVNEMRGDLTEVSSATETALRELSAFNVSENNPYDSAYVYYRIINNCNYYIAHRDTTLATGNRHVAMMEFAEAKAVRAWAYLQLAKTYGSVPFYTNPVLNIADVETAANMPRKDIKGICEALAPDLEQYAGYTVPDYGTFDAGNSNLGQAKTITTALTMLPVDVVLGDLYLESQQYRLAAKHYAAYLLQNKLAAVNYAASPFYYPNMQDLPKDFQYTQSLNSFTASFSMNYPTGLVTYVPMATNRLNGVITSLPKLFGYDFYATDAYSAYTSSQIVPSIAYKNLCTSQSYYYRPSTATTGNNVVSQVEIGDMRYFNTCQSFTVNNVAADTATTYQIMTKYNGANVPLYRVSGIYLKLAEALNRMEYPDAAFAILKDGLNSTLTNDTTYLSSATKQLLESAEFAFLTEANAATFAESEGIHAHGCGYTETMFSPYKMKDIVGAKMQEIANTFGVTVGTTKNDTINAVEDLICDEYAMELAFEGSRFGDLCRLARNKNNAGTYGSNFGSMWLARKLAHKNVAVDLTNEQNWYLPFK